MSVFIYYKPKFSFTVLTYSIHRHSGQRCLAQLNIRVRQIAVVVNPIKLNTERNGMFASFAININGYLCLNRYFV